MTSQAISLEAAPKRRLRPLVALRAFLKVLRDPEDTENGARLVLSLDGDRFEQNFQRFARDPGGARMLAEGRHLDAYLDDWDRLRTLPADSLGQAYLAFMEEEGLTADGLERAVAPVEQEIEAECGPLDAPRRLFGDRARVLHDVWHVVTGYSRDLMGELQLLAFSYEQLHTRAYAWMVPLATFANEFRIPGTRARVELARRRARNAPWLPAVDWASRLDRPLDQVRTELRVGAPPAYERYYRAPNGFGLISEAEYRAKRAARSEPQIEAGPTNGTWPPQEEESFLRRPRPRRCGTKFME
jgi:ubiquinone biosynthesis protein COQ4